MATTGAKKKWVAPSFDDDITIIKTFDNENRKRRAERNSTSVRSKFSKPSFESYKASYVESSWLERFEPQTKKDLAVNNKKVKQVEDWILHNYNTTFNDDKISQILILTGPSGAGKTATVHALAKEHRLEILEWADPNKVADEWKHDGPEMLNQTTAFNNFLFRASRYSSLLNTKQICSGKKILLVEEIPNIFYKESSNLHSLLRKFCQQRSKCPIIFIISGTGTSVNTDLNLFPKDFLEELKITVINFNPITPLSITKTLTLILNEVCKRQLHNKNELLTLAETCDGDIRAAINTLQLALQTNNKSKKTTSQLARLTNLGGKNLSLVLFHSLGKVLYCKREPEKNEPKLPQHLSKMRRVPLKENPELIFERTLITAEGFTQFLHENYLDFFFNMERTANCSESFSDVDCLLSEWSVRDHLNVYSSSIAIRSLMFNLNLPNEPRQTCGSLFQFKKPRWYDVRKMQTLQLKRVQSEFEYNHLGLGRDLQTTLIPYANIIRPVGLSAAQIDLCSSLSDFKSTTRSSGGGIYRKMPFIDSAKNKFDQASRVNVLETDDPEEFNIEDD